MHRFEQEIGGTGDPRLVVAAESRSNRVCRWPDGGGGDIGGSLERNVPLLQSIVCHATD